MITIKKVAIARPSVPPAARPKLQPKYIPEVVFEAAVKSVHIEIGAIKFGQFDSMVVLDETHPKKYIDKVKVAKRVCQHGDIAWLGDWDTKIKVRRNPAVQEWKEERGTDLIFNSSNRRTNLVPVLICCRLCRR